MRTKFVSLVVITALVAGGTMQGRDGKDSGDDVLKKLQGTWRFTAQEVDGKPRSKDELAKQTITFVGDKWTVRQGSKVTQGGTHKFNPDKKPPQVDAAVKEGEDKGSTMLGIYEMKENSMKVCFDMKGKERPNDFTSKVGRMTATVEREKK